VVARRLQAVAEHHRHQQSHPQARRFDVPEERDYVRRRKVATKLLKAFESLVEALLKHAPEDLIQALAGAAPHLRSGSMHDWEQDLIVLTDEVRHLLLMQRGKRGRPGLRSRRRLEEQVKRELKAANIRLTKGRDGVFAKTLLVMYEIGGEPAPEDVFPVLARLLPRRTVRNSSTNLGI
jgi:hypothetical protein